MKKFITVVAALLFSGSLQAGVDPANAKTFEEFCQVADWNDGKLDTRTIEKQYSALKIAQPLSPEEAVKKLQGKAKNHIVIDARKGSDRVSKISGAVLATADYQNAADDEFKDEGSLVSAIKKRKKELKNHGLDPKSFSFDMFKDATTILFCNGFKCHRSTYAACMARKMGLQFENLHIVLGGFDALKAAGAKIK